MQRNHVGVGVRKQEVSTIECELQRGLSGVPYVWPLTHAAVGEKETHFNQTSKQSPLHVHLLSDPTTSVFHCVNMLFQAALSVCGVGGVGLMQIG